MSDTPVNTSDAEPDGDLKRSITGRLLFLYVLGDVLGSGVHVRARPAAQLEREEQPWASSAAEMHVVVATDGSRQSLAPAEQLMFSPTPPTPPTSRWSAW